MPSVARRTTKERADRGELQVVAVEDIPVLSFIFESDMALNRKKVEAQFDIGIDVDCAICGVGLEIGGPSPSAEKEKGNRQCAAFDKVTPVLSTDHLADAQLTCSIVQTLIEAKKYYNLATVLHLLFSLVYCPPVHSECHNRLTLYKNTKKFFFNQKEHITWFIGLSPQQLHAHDTKGMDKIGGPRINYLAGRDRVGPEDGAPWIAAGKSLRQILRDEAKLVQDRTLLVT